MLLGYSPMTPGSSSNASSPYHPSTPSRGGGGDSDMLAGQDWYSPDIEVKNYLFDLESVQNS